MKNKLLILAFLLASCFQGMAQTTTASEANATIEAKIPDRGVRPTGYKAIDVRDAMKKIVLYAQTVQRQAFVADSLANVNKTALAGKQATITPGSLALNSLSVAGVSTNQVLKFNGTVWTYGNDDSGAGGTSTWGGLSGNLSNQTDLQNALNSKVNIVGGQTLMTDGERIKLAGITTGATANSPDAFLLALSNSTGNLNASRITESASYRFTTDGEKLTWNGKQDAIGTGGLALNKIAQGGATSDQVLKWNGTAWAPAADNAGSGGGGVELGTTSGTAFRGDYGQAAYNNIATTALKASKDTLSNFVGKANTETITGAKTFSAGISMGNLTVTGTLTNSTLTATIGTKADTASLNSVARSRVPYATSIQLRAGLVGYPEVVILTDMQGYTFRRDITNTMADDSAMVIRLGSTIRYVRQTTVLRPEFWKGKADGVAATGAGTDNWKAIQKSFDYAKISALPIELDSGTYRFTKQLKFFQSGSFSKAGIQFKGKGIYSTKLMPSGITGAAILLEGNENKVAGEHAHGFQFGHYSIVRDVTSGAITHGMELRAIYNSVLTNIGIEGQPGDGLRLIGTMYGDVGSNELIDLSNIYIKFNAGWGINMRSEVSTAVPLAVATLDKVFVNGNGKGVYMEGVQQIEWNYGGVITNADSNLVFGHRGTSCSLIKFTGTELGNMTTAKPMVSIGSIQNITFDNCRWVNNPTELATHGVQIGYKNAEKYVKNITFIKPWIVQANSSLSSYKWLDINDSVSVGSNIQILDADYRILAAGTGIPNLARVTRYTVDGIELRSAGVPETFAANNLTSYTPSLTTGRISILSYTTATTTAIAAPSTSNPPVVGDRLTFIIRNNGGRPVLNFNSIYVTTDLTTSPKLYGDRTLTFIWASDGSWHQEQSIKPVPYTEYLTNPTTITPVVGGFHRASYNSTTSTTIANPSVSGTYEDGDEFRIQLYNTAGVGAVPTFSLGDSYISPGTIEFPTVQYQGYILKFEYMAGYWSRVK